jgi:ABC-type transport system involved in multi-copper enzyme maturation permease subunit
MNFSIDFSSPFLWLFAALMLAGLALLFISIIKKNKAALYACLIILVMLIGIALYFVPISVSQTKVPTPETTITPYNGTAPTSPDLPVVPTETLPEPVVVVPPITTTQTSASSDEPRVLTAAETDASWETYTSPGFGFTIMTPLKIRQLTQAGFRLRRSFATFQASLVPHLPVPASLYTAE